jgi:hypothetical protein
MEVKWLVLPMVWVVSVLLDMILLRMLEEKKLNFSQLVDKELFTLIIMCVFAPVTFSILLLGVLIKTGIAMANNLPISHVTVKGCSNCIHRCNNECMLYQLNRRPKMLCKGRLFYNLVHMNDKMV